MNYVNQIKTKDGTEYEIHDSRMPEVPSGGTQLYKHTLTTNSGDVLEIISNDNTPITTFVGKSEMALHKLQLQGQTLNYKIGHSNMGGNVATLYGIRVAPVDSSFVIQEATNPVYTLNDVVTEL